jgi:hypothetical protein
LLNDFDDIKKWESEYNFKILTGKGEQK